MFRRPDTPNSSSPSAPRARRLRAHPFPNLLFVNKPSQSYSGVKYVSLGAPIASGRPSPGQSLSPPTTPPSPVSLRRPSATWDFATHPATDSSVGTISVPPKSPGHAIEANAAIKSFITACREFQNTDIPYLFHQQPSYTHFHNHIHLICPASFTDFVTLSEQYRSSHVSIGYNLTTCCISIQPRPSMRGGETPLHKSLAIWASSCYSRMILTTTTSSNKPSRAFLGIEDFLDVVSTSFSSSILPTNAFVDSHGHKRMAERFKTADHVYMFRGQRYPGVVFEMGWTESLTDLRRDAVQWLLRTNPRRSSSAATGAKAGTTERGVRVVILGKLYEVKTDELMERERKRLRVLDRLDDELEQSPAAGNAVPAYDDDALDDEDYLMLEAFEDDLLAQQDRHQQPCDTEPHPQLSNDLPDLDMETIACDDEYTTFDEGDDDPTTIPTDCTEEEPSHDSTISDLSFASNLSSAPDTFHTARTKINPDNWVGTISCTLEVWRLRHDDTTKNSTSPTLEPYLESTHIVLPRPQRSRKLYISRSDIIPEIQARQRKGKAGNSHLFELPLDRLREELVEARNEYAFERLCAWRDRYLERKHGRMWREEYLHKKGRDREKLEQEQKQEQQQEQRQEQEQEQE